MNDIALLVRLCYWDPYPEAARHWRFAWFRDQTLPRLLAQTAEFDLWVWVNPDHRAEVEAMSSRIRTFTVDSTHIDFDGRIPWRKVRELPQYPVQFRVDSDDLVSPDYIATGIAALNTIPRPLRALAHFQPYKVDITTGAVYWCAPRKGRPYGPRYPSAFAALRQPFDDRFDWIYGYGHTELWHLADQVVSIPAGFCWAACHTFNDSTGLWPGDVPLPDAPVPTGLPTPITYIAEAG